MLSYLFRLFLIKIFLYRMSIHCSFPILRGKEAASKIYAMQLKVFTFLSYSMIKSPHDWDKTPFDRESTVEQVEAN